MDTLTLNTYVPPANGKKKKTASTLRKTTAKPKGTAKPTFVKRLIGPRLSKLPEVDGPVKTAVTLVKPKLVRNKTNELRKGSVAEAVVDDEPRTASWFSPPVVSVVDDSCQSVLAASSSYKAGQLATKWFTGSRAAVHVQFPEPPKSEEVSNKSERAAPRKSRPSPTPKPAVQAAKGAADEYLSLYYGDCESGGGAAATDAEVQPLEERLFSKKTFQDLGVHPHLVGNLSQLFGITSATVVQKKTIPELLSGKHALVRSQTGSGKTLAYAVPIMHSLEAARPKLSRKDGVKALVVLPTRELALQTYECFAKLMRAFTWIVPGLVVGGEKRKSEKVRLRKGITVLVGTPGRLLDHAEHTDSLTLHGIDWLVIDEADKLLEMGYEKDIAQLIAIVESHRDRAGAVVGRKQTVLLSATLSQGVERLANLTLHEPCRIDACTSSITTTDGPATLVIPRAVQQKYLVVPAKLRLVALASFIIDATEFKNILKILVFMATQDMVDFYVGLLQTAMPRCVTFHKLHGNMSQGDRTEVFNTFRASERGILLSTDVAARGLDLSKVDSIVQFTAPTTAAEYVHRVGRTARAGAAGSSFLFLLPSELHFVSLLNSSRLKLEEINVDGFLTCLMKIKLESIDGPSWGGGIEGAATVLQQNFERAVVDESALHTLACRAYKSWVRFYATYPKDVRPIFNFKSLHLGHHAKSFALRDAPRTIGGLGRPTQAADASKSTKRRRSDNLGHTTAGSRVRRLVTSEFDSGLKRSRKKQ